MPWAIGWSYLKVRELFMALSLGLIAQSKTNIFNSKSFLGGATLERTIFSASVEF